MDTGAPLRTAGYPLLPDDWPGCGRDGDTVVVSGSSIGYEAGPGWNACTGVGVPNGESLFVALAGS